MNSKKAILYMIIFIGTRSIISMEYPKIRAVEIYQLIVPWKGKSEEVKACRLAAQETGKPQELKLDTDRRIKIFPNKENIKIFSKSSETEIPFYYLINSIDEMDETTSLISHKMENDEEPGSFCLIS